MDRTSSESDYSMTEQG